MANAGITSKMEMGRQSGSDGCQSVGFTANEMERFRMVWVANRKWQSVTGKAWKQTKMGRRFKAVCPRPRPWELE